MNQRILWLAVVCACMAGARKAQAGTARAAVATYATYATKLTASDAAKSGQQPASQTREPVKIDTGDHAWMLVSSALVLMMTAPGLALFYCGLVRKKNV